MRSRSVGNFVDAQEIYLRISAGRTSRKAYDSLLYTCRRATAVDRPIEIAKFV